MAIYAVRLKNLCKNRLKNLITATAVNPVVGLATHCILMGKGPIPSWSRAFFMALRKVKLGVAGWNRVGTGMFWRGIFMPNITKVSYA